MNKLNFVTKTYSEKDPVKEDGKISQRRPY